MQPESLGHFQIEKVIARSQMAEVYLGHSKELPDHKVILKVLGESADVDRFKKEARNLIKLKDHPNICRLIDFFEENGRTIIVMEYIEGATLADIIKIHDASDIGTALKVSCDTLEVLKYVHERGIFHRDIKPGNIMIDRQGKVRIIDFGIAKDIRITGETAAGICLGTPEYAAPEQFRITDDVDWARADIYCLGSTLYEVLTKKLPYTQKGYIALAEAKRMGPPEQPSTLNSEVTNQLDEIVMKSLQPGPKKRYGSAAEMLDELALLWSDGSALTARKHLPATVEVILDEQKRPTLGKRLRLGSADIARISSIAKPGDYRLTVAAILMASVAAFLLWGPTIFNNEQSHVEPGADSTHIPATGTSSSLANEQPEEVIDSFLVPPTNTGNDRLASNEREQSELNGPGAAVASNGNENSKETVPSEPEPADSGSILIGSDLGVCAVLIDNVSQTQKTPYTFVLAAGEHRIQVLHPVTNAARETTLVIEGGVNHSYTARFSDP